MKKNKLTNLLKSGILFLGITFLLWNCEKEDEFISPSTNQVNKDFKFQKKSFNELIVNQKFEKAFNQTIRQKTKSSYKSKSNKKDVYNFSIDSSTINQLEYKSTTYYTMLIKRDKEKNNFFENLLIKVDSLENSSAFILKYTPNKKTEYIENHNSFNFSGDVSVTAIDYNKIKNIAAKSQYSCYQVQEVWCSWEEDHVASGSCFSNNHLYAKTVTQCGFTDDGTGESNNDYYSEGGTTSGGGDGMNNDLGEGNENDPNQLFTIPVDCKDCPDAFDDTIVEDDDQIIDELTGEAKCVYDKLISSSTGFKNAIQKFDGEFPVSHLKLIMEDLGNTRAETRAPDGAGNSPDYVITIALNNNSNIHGVNYRPNLMTAKTIAHEVIHAEMFRKLLSFLDNGGNLSGVTRQDILDKSKDFPGIYDYYRRHKNSQHQQMATHYRQTIADVLKEFDNNQHSNQFYLDLAWEGLKYPSIYTWSSQSQQEKDRINKVINDYINVNKNQNCQ